MMRGPLFQKVLPALLILLLVGPFVLRSALVMAATGGTTNTSSATIPSMSSGLSGGGSTSGASNATGVNSTNVQSPTNVPANPPLSNPNPSTGGGGCTGRCSQESAKQTDKTLKHLWDETYKTIEHIKQQFILHRKWMVDFLFQQRILPALMLFAEQITAMAMHQVTIIGAFFDAKHQLESQRLFQQLMAEAHKDYHPSEGMCTFGTSVRSLAASDRNTDLTAIAISNRVIQRQLLSGDTVSGGGRVSDALSRIAQFRSVYCNKEDNGGGLENLCPTPPTQKERFNKDIDFTATLDGPLTLKLDFTSTGDGDHAANTHSTNVSPDEEDLFALSANLYAHNVAPSIPPALITDETGGKQANPAAVQAYMNLRALAAKRSVAQNSFAAIAAMKSQGASEVQPYLYAIMKEMGVSNDTEIKDYLGDRPSYYAQMEMLTKKLYQNPTFYTELYDKPANVGRKAVAMQAIELMQRRDMYRSVLRSEATLSVMLETALAKRQEQVTNDINRLTDDADPIQLP